MTKHQYYRDGTEISEAEALDHRGLLRDQTSMRVRTTMRDSPPLWAEADPRDSSFGSTGFGSSGQRGDQPGDLCSIDGRPGRLKKVGGELRCVPGSRDGIGFTDGSGDPWSASRPGFRVRVGDRREAQRDAYARYNVMVSTAYRLRDGEISCPTCDGSGMAADGGPCERCAGDGIVDADDGYESSTNEAVENTAADRRRNDSRPLAQRMQDHKHTMDALYRARDAELENAWRNK